MTAIFIGQPARGIIDPEALLSQIPGFSQRRFQRFSQYVRRAIANIRHIRQVQGLDLPEVPEPENGLGSWTPLQALAVLTYGPSSHLNLRLIAEIELLTGLALPHDERQSRHEAAFYVEYLTPLLACFEEQQPGLQTEVIPQFFCRSDKRRTCWSLTKPIIWSQRTAKQTNSVMPTSSSRRASDRSE